MPDEKNVATSQVASVSGNHSDSSHSQKKKGPRAMLRDLYRLNQLHAQMVLYKDYINLTQNPSPDFVATDKYFEDLEQHLHRYSRAKKEYQAFVAAHKHVNPNPSMTSKLLLQVATRITKQQQQQQQMQKPSDDLPATSKIDEAKKKFQGAFQDPIDILNWDTDFQRDKADRKREEHYLLNFKTAFFGSLALVTPMLIMTLHQTKLTSLLTTSSFVLAVAVILAAFDAEPGDIITATAGYAAVLVVFVGTGAGSTVAVSPKPASNRHHSELSRGAIAGIAVTGVLVVAFLVILVFVVKWDPLTKCRRSIVKWFVLIVRWFSYDSMAVRREDFDMVDPKELDISDVYSDV